MVRFWWRVAIGAVALVSTAIAADAAPSFVYVAAPICASGSSCAPQVLVYDATTAALVTSIGLPLNTSPAGIVISRDGARLYVSLRSQANDGSPSLAVVDLTSHLFLAQYPATAAGPLAISRDGARVFISAQNAIAVFDVAGHGVVSTIQSGLVLGLAASSSLDRLYTTSFDPSASPRSMLREFDSRTGVAMSAAAARSDLTWSDVHVSADGTRLYATASSSWSSPSAGGGVSIFDPSTWQLVHDLRMPASPMGSVDAAGRGRLYSWDNQRIYVSDLTTYAAVDWMALASIRSMVVTPDGARAWAMTARDDSLGSVDALVAIDLSTDATVSTILLNGSATIAAVTPPGAKTCSYAVSGGQASWTTGGGSSPITVTTACAWAASSSAPWAHLDKPSGVGGTALTLIVDPNGGSATRTATITIGGQTLFVAQAGSMSAAPFGMVDTPSNNVSGVSGAIAVGGWALDDVGVADVAVYRDPINGEPSGDVFIGNATLIVGARPDVQAMYAAYPNASRAGWGLQVLTNMLPGGGNGTYTLRVYADDVDGHRTLLGARTITCNNARATMPFGSIDTPGQGATVSGTVVNFGWALTPNPAMIPFDGSTIDVLIDGVVVGHPAYGFARTDIDGMFPGYANTGHAVGNFSIDTTKLSNGLHTIAWVVHDSLGATQGIGSRFFTVAN
jgi:Viral BACON domain